MERGDCWVDLWLTQFSPDVGPFPIDANFALQLLTHEAYNTDDEGSCALGRAIDYGSSNLPDDLAPVVSEYIQQVRLYYAENLPWNVETWDGESSMPTARYRITVTDPKWIEHLKVGQGFDTAAFCQEFGTDWKTYQIENSRDHVEWVYTNRNLPALADTNADKARTTQLLPKIVHSPPLCGSYVGDRSVEFMRFEDGRLLAGCPYALELHSMSLEDGSVQSRSAKESEFDEFRSDTYSLDDLEEGIIRREGHADIVFPDAPWLNIIVTLPQGFLVQVEESEFVYVSETGERSATDLLPQGGQPVVHGDHVLIPYAFPYGGWVLWNWKTQTSITSRLTQTGPSCTAVWHGDVGRVSAWSTPSEDPCLADQVWLEFEPA